MAKREKKVNLYGFNEAIKYHEAHLPIIQAQTNKHIANLTSTILLPISPSTRPHHFDANPRF
jgi:hypothetical protein